MVAMETGDTSLCPVNPLRNCYCEVANQNPAAARDRNLTNRASVQEGFNCLTVWGGRSRAQVAANLVLRLCHRNLGAFVLMAPMGTSFIQEEPKANMLYKPSFPRSSSG